MTRSKNGGIAFKRHKKVLKLAKGYWGKKSKIFRPANQQVMKSLAFAYTHRRKKKGDFRRLWITRINAAARLNGLSYSRFINGLKLAGVEINRKILSDLAISDHEAFNKLADVAKESLNK